MFEYDAPRWCDLSNISEDPKADEWFNKPHPILELTQTAYLLLVGESIAPGVELDEDQRTALDREWEAVIHPPRSPAKSPGKFSPRRLFSPGKVVGPPRRALAPVTSNSNPLPMVKAEAARPAKPPPRMPATMRFTAAPKLK